MILNTKRIHNSFRRNFPARAKQMPQCRWVAVYIYLAASRLGKGQQ